MEIIEPGIESCDQQFATVKAVLIGNGFAFVAARLCTMIICINYGWDVDSSARLICSRVQSAEGEIIVTTKHFHARAMSTERKEIVNSRRGDDCVTN